MTVVCNRTNCAFNGGSFCKKDILILNAGLCDEWVDKNCNPRPVPDYMVRPAEARPEAAEGLVKESAEATTAP